MSLSLFLFLLGRLLMGGYFIQAGVKHFIGWQGMLGYTKSKGIPFPAFSLAIGSLLLILGGAGILLGALIPWAVAGLIVFLIVASVTMHAYWKDTDPMARMSNQINFLKNIALIGALLMLLSIATPWMVALG